MREYTKALESAQEAEEQDTENKHTREITEQQYKCQQALFQQRAGEGDEEMEDAQQEEEGYSASGVPRHIDQHSNVLYCHNTLVVNVALG